MCSVVKYFLLFFIGFGLPVFGETVSPEILNLKAENNFILVDVAKKYPEVKISQFENPDKILIEFLNTSYHKTFRFDDSDKNKILSGLDFASGITVGQSNEKVSIILNLKQGYKLSPKVLSTKDNTVKISFLPIDDAGDQNHPISLNQNEEKAGDEDIVGVFNNAVEEQSKGNLDKAEEIYRDLISKNSDFYIAKYNLAKVCIDKGKYDDSISLLLSLLEKADKKSENYNLFLNTLGTAYYLKDDLESALKRFGEAIINDPNFFQSYFNLGLVYEKAKDFKRAKSNFQKAINLKSDFAEAYYHIAVLDLISKHKKDAKIGFKKVIELARGTKMARLSQEELKNLE